MNTRTYDDVLPSKFGLEDEPIIDRTEDVTEFMGHVEQYEYVTTRKIEAEKQWELIEKQIRLRVSQCLQETLAEAKCKMKESMYKNEFVDVCENLRFDAANLTLINSRYL